MRCHRSGPWFTESARHCRARPSPRSCSAPRWCARKTTVEVRAPLLVAAGLRARSGRCARRTSYLTGVRHGIKIRGRHFATVPAIGTCVRGMRKDTLIRHGWPHTVQLDISIAGEQPLHPSCDLVGCRGFLHNRARPVMRTKTRISIRLRSRPIRPEAAAALGESPLPSWYRMPGLPRYFSTYAPLMPCHSRSSGRDSLQLMPEPVACP